MVKKVNAHLQKTRKLQSASHNKYDKLLDQMSADYAHAGAQHYKWNEKKEQWRRIKRRNSNVRNNYLSSNSYLL